MLSKPTSGIAAFGLLFMFWPIAADAQVTAPREAAPLSYGPVSLYPTLQISDAGKDSNVFNDAHDAKEDYTLTVSSRALVVGRLGANELLASVGSDYVWFQQYASERSSNGTYGLRFNLSASRFKPFIGAERARTRNRPSSEIDARARRLITRYLAGSSFSVTDRTSITASAEQYHSEYDPDARFNGVDLAEALNASGGSYAGGVRYQVTALTSVRVEGTYQTDRFPESHIRDAKTYSLTPTVEFSPDASIHGTASVGIEVFKPVDPQLSEYKGPTYNASLNWTLFNRTTFDVHGARRVSYSYLDSEPYYLLTRAGFSVLQRVMGPVSVHGGAEREMLSYRWRPGALLRADAASAPRLGLLDTFRGGVSVALPRGFKVGLAAERIRRQSGGESLPDYTRTRLLSTITIGS